MAPVLHRPAIRSALLLPAVLSLVGTLVIVPTAFGGHTKLVCGKPTKTGRFTVVFFVKKGDAAPVKRTIPVEVDSSFTVGDKLVAILSTLTTPGLGDTVGATGDYGTGKIEFEGRNGWVIDNVGVIDDGTEEPDEFALGIPPPQQDAVCSLGSVATGSDLHDRQAFVRLTVGPVDVRVPTQPGMPAVVAEQLLIQQLNARGVAARFANGDDFAGYETLPHDGQVIWFPIADTTGFREEITDVGLHLDVAAVMNNSPNAPASAGDPVGTPGMRLEVCPSIFSGYGVTIRYSGGAAEGRLRLELFDPSGRRVRTLLEEGLSAGGAVSWDGRDERNRPVPGGVYFVRLATSRGDLVRRVVRIHG